jgi:dihydroneopterin aldolase
MQLILENIQFHAFHGVFTEENKIGNTFIITITLDIDLQKASETDDLNDTINYQHIYDEVKAQMQIQSKLIEHVTGRILRAIMSKFAQVSKAEIRLKKINPPLGGQVESATIVMSQTR